jgi:hypothetical protein
MRTALDKVNERMKALHSDEERQRANITALANADKTSRERFVRDLNSTEDQIASAQKELTAAQAASGGEGRFGKQDRVIADRREDLGLAA